MLKCRSVAVSLLLLVPGVVLRAQTPTITSVQNESGSSNLCPGGIAFVNGTNLGGAGASVTVAGMKAYVVNASNTSLQIELPVNAPLGPTTLTVGASTPFNITLGQYAPGIATNGGSGNNVVFAYHYPSQAPVTSAFPASPNEQIFFTATGLGPTNPVVATGTEPSNNNVVPVTLPTVTVGGKSATGVSAFLSGPGFFTVILTVPASTPNGTQQVVLSIGGLNSETLPIAVFNGPIIGAVENAASNIAPGLPNAQLAQGAIFVIKGNNLGPANLITATAPFQNTTVGGTSIAVTVGSTTVNALMYYTSATQVAALLPSNTPTGAGAFTVTYNGQTSPPQNHGIVTNNLALFTFDSSGSGPAIATYPDGSLVSAAPTTSPCGGLYVPCGAVNPGDAINFWATGLGAVNGSDAAGAGLGQNMPSIPLTVWLGGVQITPQYQGRGCCIGEDQIQIVVPKNVPTGCAVPLAIQINNFVSNYAVLPVAVGSRTCTPANAALAAGSIEQTVAAGQFTYGQIDLDHFLVGPGAYQDQTKITFAKILGIAPGTQPFFLSWVDDPPPGTCIVNNNLNGPGLNAPISNIALVDAGPNFTIKGPSGSLQAAGSSGSKVTLSAAGTFLVPGGTYTVSGTGGADIGPFIASITLPVSPTLTSPANNATVTRSNGMTVNWSGGGANQYVQMTVAGATDNTFSNGSAAYCTVPAAPGTFTIPPYVLDALPPGVNAGFAFGPAAPAVQATAAGLSVGILDTRINGTGFGYGDYYGPTGGAASGSFTLQ